MAQFDPAQRRETWVFREMFTEHGRKVWKRAGFNFVEYDGSPERYIEPVNDFMFSVPVGEGGADASLIDPHVDGTGSVVGFEFINEQDWNGVQHFG